MGVKSRMSSVLLALVAVACAAPGAARSTETAAPTRTPAATPSPSSESTSGTATVAVEGVSELNVTILFDNNAYDSRLETGWGFSCLVEGPERTVLFDAGDDSGKLLGNMLALEKGIPLLASKYTMFETSGRLYGAGLPSCGLFELTLRQWREAMGEKE